MGPQNLLLLFLVTPTLRAEARLTDGSSLPTERVATSREAPADGDTIEPPRLERYVEAPYPPEALEAGVEGRVHLLLTVSADGTVTDAEITAGLGHGLDEAARSAALGFLFRPARVRGEARAARIRYAYEFRLPEQLAQGDDDAPGTASPAQQNPGGQGAAPPSADSPNADDDSVPPARSAGDAAAPESTAAPPEAEIVIAGQRPGDRLRRSANAVMVLDLALAKKESADVGEVLARAEGVNVQRMGGVGSRARFTLGGFDEHQVRFFIDGVPLEYSGYTFGLQNVPIAFAERIDVYKGVVPVRLGADALGGAFDVVTDRGTRGTKSAVSFQGGSFGTYRFAASGRHLAERTGLFGKVEAFHDVADNDYSVDVQVADAQGRLAPARVHRRHDAYRASGGNVEVGLVNRPWARRLLARVFATDYSKELQHNVTMSVPYGEASYGGFTAGGSLRYEHDFGRGLSGSFVTGYVFDRADFRDRAGCVYDWYRRCVVERRTPGEMGDRASDRSLWDHTGYARWNLAWAWSPEQALRFSIAPTFFTRTGEERAQPSASSFDKLHARRDMAKWINGVEHEANLLDGRLQNLGFVKAYLQIAQAEELLTADVAVQRNFQRAFFGVGDALRYQLNDWAFVKVSYEYAIRLPEPTEIFGNGIQIADNLVLEPERSHNVNLTLLMDALQTPAGLLRGSVTGFHRRAENLIVLIGREDVFRYENVFGARVLGLEVGSTWTSPGELLEVGANTSYQDARNTSHEGTFGQFAGDRIPNRPYLTANGHLRLRHRGLTSDRDELSFAWYSRYVHEFHRGWESVGRAPLKPTVDSQLLHTAALSYVTSGASPEELSFSLEVQNLTDERAFDFYGVQRPGRAFFAKTTAVF